MNERENQMVLRASDGDLESFGQLAERYQSAVYGLAYHWTRNFADAEDVVQEALVQAFERLHQLREPGRFPGWLRMIALNICRKRHRGGKRQEMSIDAPDYVGLREQLVDPGPPPDQAIETQQVLDILDVLSEPVRLTVTLFYIDDLTHKEISQFLDVPVSTVKSRLHRARRVLKEEALQMVEERFAGQEKPRIEVRDVSGYLHVQEGQGYGWLRPTAEAEAAPDDIVVAWVHISSFDLVPGDYIEGKFHTITTNKPGRGTLGLERVNGESVDAAHRCSFCGKRKDEVPKFVKGPGVNICSGCVELCNEVLTSVDDGS